MISASPQGVSQSQSHVISTIYPLSDLILQEATDPTLIRQVWLNNKFHWGQDLSDEVWLASGADRSGQDYGPRTTHRIWILCHQDADLHDPGSVLSAVHTFERPGLLANRRQSSLSFSEGMQDGGKDGAVREIRVVSVLLLFTPLQERGKGYARYLMRLLWDRLEKQKDPVVQFTFLYSALGPKFYGPLGWETLRSVEVVIPANHTFPPLAPPRASLDDHDKAQASAVIERITEANLQTVVDRDLALIRSEFIHRSSSSSTSSPSSSDQTWIAILPEARCIRRHLAKEKFIAHSVLGQDPKNPDHLALALGVRLFNNYNSQEDSHGSGKEDDNAAFILWHHAWQQRQLSILRIRYKTVDQLQALLIEAVKEAKAWNLTEVTVWNLDDQDALRATGGLSNVERKVAIGCLGRFKDEKVDDTPVELLLNEAFIWC